MTGMSHSMSAGVLVAGLVLSGSLWAQSKAAAPEGFDVVVTKAKGGQKIVCMYGRKPCDQSQVNQLAKAVHAKGFDVYLDGPNGSLRCTTRSGIPCAEDHVREVQAVTRTLGAT